MATVQHQILLQALSEIRVPLERFCIYEDNNSIPALSKNSKIHKRTKHIDVDFHYVREKVQAGLHILRVDSANNLADICTKALPRVRLESLARRIHDDK